MGWRDDAIPVGEMSPEEAQRELSSIMAYADRLKNKEDADKANGIVRDVLGENATLADRNSWEAEGLRARFLGEVADPDLRGSLLDAGSGDHSLLKRAAAIPAMTVQGLSGHLRYALGLLAPGLVDKIDDLDMQLYQATGGKLGTKHTVDPMTQALISRSVAVGGLPEDPKTKYEK